MNLPNDTKIKFCNAMHEMYMHSKECSACMNYFVFGEGDLCQHGHTVIAAHLAYADTNLSPSQQPQ